MNTSGEACEYFFITHRAFIPVKLISFLQLHTVANSLFLKIDAAKSGVEPSSVVELARHVNMQCPNLVFSGLMTIGMPDYTSTPENFRVCYFIHSVECFFQFQIRLLFKYHNIQTSWFFWTNLLTKVLFFSPHNLDQTLTNCRAEVCKALGMSEDQFELSMGMSGDFEQAVISLSLL